HSGITHHERSRPPPRDRVGRLPLSGLQPPVLRGTGGSARRDGDPADLPPPPAQPAGQARPRARAARPRSATLAMGETLAAPGNTTALAPRGAGPLASSQSNLVGSWRSAVPGDVRKAWNEAGSTSPRNPGLPDPSPGRSSRAARSGSVRGTCLRRPGNGGLRARGPG